MIGRLIRFRLRALWRDLKRPEAAFVSLVLAALGVIYGLLFGFLAGEMVEQGKTESSFQILRIVISGLGGLTLMRMFFPQYKPLQDPFPVYLPLSPGQRYAYNLLLDFLHPFFGWGLIFLGSVLVSVPGYRLEVILAGIGVMGAAHVLRRSLQYAFEGRLEGRRLMVVLGGLALVAAAVTTLWLGPLLHGSLTWLLASGLLAIGGRTLHPALHSAQRRPQSTPSTSFLPTGRWSRLLWGRPKPRRLLLFGFGFKLVFGGFLLWMEQHTIKGDSFFFPVLMIATPFAHFSYVYNNLWGHWGALWRMMDQSGSRQHDFLVAAGRLMAVPLMLDTVLNGALLTQFTSDGLLIGYYQLASLLLMSTTALYWSTVHPKTPVAQAVASMHGGTSKTGNYVLILIITLNALAWMAHERTSWPIMPLWLVLSAFLSWGFYHMSREAWPSRRYHIAARL